MSAPHQGSYSAAEERARRAFRALPAPQAEPGFRARLRQDFAAGRIPERPDVVRGGARFSRLPRFVRMALPLAAAFAVVFGGSQRLNRGAPWQLAGPEARGTLTVDGAAVSPASAGAVAARLHPGARLHFEGPVPIELASSGQVLLELVPGTDLTLPAPPGRWWARSAHIALRSGEIRVSTGEKFHGARLHVTTSQAEVHVTGTTFAVICFPEGTCVCVCEGTVAVGEHGKEPVPISAGHRRFIYNSGKPPLIDAILPREEVQLGRMCAGRDSALGGR